MKIINIQLDDESQEIVERIQEETGASIAEIVRRALKAYKK